MRLTAHYVICQVVYSEIDGDKVLAAAYSSELKAYGLTVGLKNYAAAYATGLLVARRLLARLGLADVYAGNADPDGSVVKSEHTNETNGRKRTYWVSEVAEERKPFRCLLDVGIRTTTTGARVFGAMKGAADGGLDIPHNEKRFPGYDRDSKEYDPESLKERIYGRHVADYMEMMQEEDPDTFEKYFSRYSAAGVEPDAMEDLYREVHEKIRANPKPRECVGREGGGGAAGCAGLRRCGAAGAGASSRGAQHAAACVRPRGCLPPPPTPPQSVLAPVIPSSRRPPVARPPTPPRPARSRKDRVQVRARVQAHQQAHHGGAQGRRRRQEGGAHCVAAGRAGRRRRARGGRRVSARFLLLRRVWEVGTRLRVRGHILEDSEGGHGPTHGPG